MWTSKTTWLLSGLLGAALLAACDRSGSDLIPQPSDDYPSVIELGAVPVISTNDLADFAANGCTLDDPASGCVWSQVGSSVSSGVRAGVTFTFNGTGGDVCLIVDPEAVTWNTSVAADVLPGDAAWQYRYPDNIRDDADLDLFAGLTTYYTGSPGVELGDFVGYYTDSLGSTVSIEYSACDQIGSRGQSNAHGGRGAVEYCTVDTSGRNGISYTVVLENFAVPLDDAVIAFQAVVVDGDCSEAYLGGAPNECMLTGEAVDIGTGAVRDGVVELESAYCDTSAKGPTLVAFCCENPDMCGEEPEGLCDEYSEALEQGEIEFD